MKQTRKRPSAVALIVNTVIGIALATQVRAVTSDIGRTLATVAGAAQPTPPGPEADPYMRHAPGGYDYERELPLNVP